jgi:hypothetical protein
MKVGAILPARCEEGSPERATLSLKRRPGRGVRVAGRGLPRQANLMRRALHYRDPIIDFIGRRGGFPALERHTGLPRVLRPGDDESSTMRVGWPEFFKAAEDHRLLFTCDDRLDQLDCAFVPRNRAASGEPRPSRLERALAFLRGLPVVRGRA